MTKLELAQKVKAKYPQYASVNDLELADKVLAKYPVYQSQITEPKTKAGQLLENIKNRITGRAENLGTDIYKAQTGELAKTDVGAGARLALRTGGAAAGTIGDILFEGLKTITPQAVKEATKSGISKLSETELAQNIATRFSDWASRNPEQAKDLEASLDIASLLPIGKGGQLAGKGLEATGRTVVKGVEASGPLVGKTLRAAGTVGEKTGKAIVSSSIPPVEQAGRVLTYKANTPLLKRFEQAMAGTEKAPITPADVLIKYNLADLSRSGIGIKAKRISNDLFENKVKPALSSIKEKASKEEIFTSIQKKINNTKDISSRKSLQNAFEAIKDDYKNVSSWNYSTLDKIKSEMAKRLPAKVWKGQDIAGDANNIRKMFSDKARQMVRSKLDKNIVIIYDEYGALKDLSNMGEKALKSGLNTNLIGLTGEAFRMATTPFTTIGGSAVSKTGSALKRLGNKIK